ncbi:MAG: hypothetical protein RL753_233, partial [Bacteroidota bacterium]
RGHTTRELRLRTKGQQPKASS